ncbi:MAG TPA: hypothetical protein VNS22_19770 [Geminicoccus sp.]|uniref:hypothetical protein n=1 Tax=Geminicoccus sp. TaxID=2024832 RepID=UPI002B9232D1|nr:hypothetical protein [Geminicoccus sp.]HWL70596.1 hypothetical protein [Geminicoccus sp.]
MFHWLVALLLSVLAGGTPAAAPAPELSDLPCSGYTQIQGELASTYAEAPVSMGLQSNGHLLQLFASSGNDTWTMVSLAPDGQACVVAAGSDWQSLKPKRPAPAVPEEGA